MDTTERPSFRRSFTLTRGAGYNASEVSCYAGGHPPDMGAQWDAFVSVTVRTGNCCVYMNGAPDQMEALAAALTEAAACCRALIASPLIAEAA